MEHYHRFRGSEFEYNIESEDLGFRSKMSTKDNHQSIQQVRGNSIDNNGKIKVDNQAQGYDGIIEALHKIRYKFTVERLIEIEECLDCIIFF